MLYQKCIRFDRVTHFEVKVYYKRIVLSAHINLKAYSFELNYIKLGINNRCVNEFRIVLG